jgi:hypothetical protein
MKQWKTKVSQPPQVHRSCNSGRQPHAQRATAAVIAAPQQLSMKTAQQAAVQKKPPNAEKEHVVKFKKNCHADITSMCPHPQCCVLATHEALQRPWQQDHPMDATKTKPCFEAHGQEDQCISLEVGHLHRDTICCDIELPPDSIRCVAMIPNER